MPEKMRMETMLRSHENVQAEPKEEQHGEKDAHVAQEQQGDENGHQTDEQHVRSVTPRQLPLRRREVALAAEALCVGVREKRLEVQVQRAHAVVVELEEQLVRHNRRIGAGIRRDLCGSSAVAVSRVGPQEMAADGELGAAQHDFLRLPAWRKRAVADCDVQGVARKRVRNDERLVPAGAGSLPPLGLESGGEERRAEGRGGRWLRVVVGLQVGEEGALLEARKAGHGVERDWDERVDEEDAEEWGVRRWRW